jgi:hypothetical protein
MGPANPRVEVVQKQEERTMGLRKILGVGMSIASEIVPTMKLWGPIIGRAIPGQVDDKAIARAMAIGERGTNMFTTFNAIVVDVQQTGHILGGNTLSNEQKALVSGTRMGNEIVMAMELAGATLPKEKADKFREACSRMGGAWADAMECFEKD